MHIWECGEWRENGTCSRGGKCGLRHVIRAEKGKGVLNILSDEPVEKDTGVKRKVHVEGAFDDGSEFIELGVGSPAGVESDETDDESGNGSESESGVSGTDEGSDDEEEEVVIGKQRVSAIPSDTPMDADEMDEDEVLGVVF